MARATNLTDASSPVRSARARLLFVAWALSVVIIVSARTPAYWIVAPCVLASVISYRIGPAKMWALYAGAACAVALAFVWTSALFTYSLDPASH
ncbi:MAG: hypothetical protein EOP37_28585 [Rubrivivax sp.]|nr:MAG: hypothetical protein EOP37_28585 [Rubrivivax sp.]